MRFTKIYTNLRTNKKIRPYPFAILTAFILIFITAFSPINWDNFQDNVSDSTFKTQSFKFYRPMVDLDLVDWVQWFGPTVFSYEEGEFWDYTEYCQGQHCGIDLGADWGTPIYAGTFGIVKYASNNEIVIWYGQGRGDGWWKIIYMNIAKYYVEPGDHVTPNTIIGTIGNHLNIQGANGIFVDHLHLEVRYDSDPAQFFKSEIHNPLLYFFDNDIYKKLNRIAISQYESNDWFYMRDVLFMGIDYPWESLIIDQGYGFMDKTWVSWQGDHNVYNGKSYYIENFPGPILSP